ncbi:hypothetical protein BEWA_016790 [Theileria equi strain WA]|uniref:Serine hydrolase FSH domain-containing protein n=1 Tax=Theileria equi strain WA TaxID=1537102 RepID=L1L916_THEEQ|nr:hypothetical protein BEWA_016790 [Theileria equi strain WA]EKX72001.1 hypothetical protein BEWA_016790 [Theileria equi strain WA]|eukprot:XP_004831453.1 hypothetical protein BEWA_016790 [Theileria equi strain WA]
MPLQVEVPSTFGHKIPKKCWFIESDNKNSKSAFILLHGWFGNLQSCLPFLNVLKKCGVLKTHHVLIVDLKDHVGKSFESNTGLKGVTDLYDSVAFLHNAHGVTKFDVYAQSISALSALMFFDCYLKVKDGSICDEPHPCGFISGVDVDLLKKVNFGDFILESPVSNISEYLSNSFSESLNWVIQQFIQTVNSRSSHHIDSLSLNTFLSNHKIRGNVHILQGMHDRVTSPKMLQNELAALKSNVNLYVFKDGGHTDLSATSPGEYLETVNYIINYKGLWKLFKFLKNKKNNLEL